jgi:hypothetical protein
MPNQRDTCHASFACRTCRRNLREYLVERLFESGDVFGLAEIQPEEEPAISELLDRLQCVGVECEQRSGNAEFQ